MQKVCKLPLVLMIVLITNYSFGQGGKGRSSVSIGAELGIPVGDLSEGWNVGFGGSLKAAFPVTQDADITLSAGLISFSGKSISFLGMTEKLPALNAIPLKVGFRNRFKGGFYLEPQLGYTIFDSKEGDSEGAFTYAGNMGFMIKNQFDISGRYEGASKDGSTLSHVGIRVAYIIPL